MKFNKNNKYRHVSVLQGTRLLYKTNNNNRRRLWRCRWSYTWAKIFTEMIMGADNDHEEMYLMVV